MALGSGFLSSGHQNGSRDGFTCTNKLELCGIVTTTLVLLTRDNSYQGMLPIAISMLRADIKCSCC